MASCEKKEMGEGQGGVSLLPDPVEGRRFVALLLTCDEEVASLATTSVLSRLLRASDGDALVGIADCVWGAGTAQNEVEFAIVFKACLGSPREDGLGGRVIVLGWVVR